MTNQEYREFLINSIMEWTNKFTVEDLRKKSIRALEIIYDNA